MTGPARKAILTIDDSPSERTVDLVDFLCEQQIPALLFVRGDRLARHPAPILYAIEKGLAIGNHTYSHRRASELGYDRAVEEIEKTETLIEEAYKRTGRPRPGKYFRFSYLDRGAGPWVLDFDKVPEIWRESVRSTFLDGLNFEKVAPPNAEQLTLKDRLQSYLKSSGFLYSVRNTVLEEACPAERPFDWPFTFSTADWMLLPRHKDRWPYRTLNDLKRRIDADSWLADPDPSRMHVILAHDDPEIFDVTRDLIMYIKDSGFVFQPVPEEKPDARTGCHHRLCHC